MWKIFTSPKDSEIYIPREEKAQSMSWLLGEAGKLAIENPTMTVFLGEFHGKDLTSGKSVLKMQEWVGVVVSKTAKYGWTLVEPKHNVKIRIG